MVEVVGTEFPRSSNQGQSGVNPAARGLQSQRLNTSSSIPGENLSCGSSRVAEYGSVQVQETPGGHIIELNDTMGSERIMIRHSSGSGIEFRPDGSVLISATNIIFDTRGDATFSVEGNMTMKSEGKMNIRSSDVEVRSGGSLSLNANSTLSYTSGKGFLTTIGGNKVETVAGFSSSIIAGQSSQVILGGEQKNVKGDMTLRVDGTGGIYSSGRMGITSSTKAFMSSPSTAINGNQIEVIGATGTIGGSEVVMYNSSSISTNSIQALTVETEAVHANYLSGNLFGNVSGTATDLGAAPTTSDTASDLKETFSATSAVANARLKTLNNGVRTVSVDPQGYILDSILKQNRNGM